jgi:hypothetical protein
MWRFDSAMYISGPKIKLTPAASAKWHSWLRSAWTAKWTATRLELQAVSIVMPRCYAISFCRNQDVWHEVKKIFKQRFPGVMGWALLREG